ncbi:hypothetical protein NECAME_18693 [Necator americanus]|uniref:Uncharacterized protein n=1 Tax=Necator americanus TaxID=51031 RepID=W2ST92_NECAM|nr:hypothetical protein NECAME_18693 [Necator americanus]ETN72728.1 hypothetical protein NECAME_18693 [Necator americanus]
MVIQRKTLSGPQKRPWKLRTAPNVPILGTTTPLISSLASCFPSFLFSS